MSGHLIHIGYPKTGSNFLRRWFAGHPQIGYADGGIAGFQDVYAMVRDRAAGAPDPAWRVTSAEGLAVPHVGFGLSRIELDGIAPQPLTVAQDATCELLRALFPDAHVLIVTRGIRGAMFSAYSQYLREGGHVSLDDFCRQSDAAAWHYDAMIARYRDALGVANVIVLPYELLRDDPPRFVRAIAARLGMEDGPIPRGRDNPSLSGIELAWYPTIARAVRRVPLRGRARLLLTILHTRVTRAARLRRIVGWLDHWRPARPVTIDDISDAMIAGWSFPTDCLRDDPVYQPYAADYFRARAQRMTA